MYDVEDEARTEAVRSAIEQGPIPLRVLAREAGVPASTLSRIRNGKLGASVAVAEAVAQALEDWSAELADIARKIRETLPAPEEGQDGL